VRSALTRSLTFEKVQKIILSITFRAPERGQLSFLGLCQHGFYDSLCSLASSLLRCGLTSNTIPLHAYSNSSLRVSGIPLPPCSISQIPTQVRPWPNGLLAILTCCGSSDSEELHQHSRLRAGTYCLSRKDAHGDFAKCKTAFAFCHKLSLAGI